MKGVYTLADPGMVMVDLPRAGGVIFIISTIVELLHDSIISAKH